MSKIGLCLSGGGARGAFQVGVMKALTELGIAPKITAYSGTSIGSVNASFFATKSIDEIISIWESISPESMKRTESYFRNLIRDHPKVTETGLFDISDLEQIIQNHLVPPLIKEKEIYVTLSEGGAVGEGFFGLLKASYNHYIKKDAKAVYIPLHKQSEEDMIRFILASCSIPIVFPGVSIGSVNYFDGGLYDNVPVKPLVDAGCNLIIVVHLHRIHFFDHKKFPHIIFHEIRHQGGLGGILNFDPERAKHTIQLGYQDTLDYCAKTPIVE
ncbi:MAG: patatin-like phospholipase family protein [Candidatus Izemoplasmatales bacterium]|nr:patatin-like phospholipase family protein [Candidatus Izemoplasmatales bacterium]MDD4988288.1 patatin-like phospholipase family protein [Candidatus Izemoplasmatales bacterium]MDD5601724.1 patatin-like phospholipase family protein [Candidatus Izemoplasmatales bacterium]NLF48375.1 patatin-like phospholipase family protein [Acholeplasmataceae bacterium]